MYNRRVFLKSLSPALLAVSSAFRCDVQSDKLLFKISLAEWSLHRALFAGEINHLDFPRIAKEDLKIDAVEYVNQFFMDKAQDKAYLSDMKGRCNTLGIKSVLIMCDNEGRIGDPDETERKKSVENHLKWVEAARFLGCHSIRVNAYSEGSYEEQQERVADGLRQLCEYADDYDINVIVENHGGLSSNGEWLVGVMKRVDHIRVGTLPDFGNFQLEKDEWYDRYRGVKELMPFAKAVSAKSGEFDSSGNDIRTDYLKMMRIVLAAGYRGYVGIEYSGQLPEIEGIRMTRELLERVRTILKQDSESHFSALESDLIV